MYEVDEKFFLNDENESRRPSYLGGGVLTALKKIGGFCQRRAWVVLPIFFTVNATALQFQTIPYTYEVDDFADFNVRVPLELPPGIKGNRPELAYVYNSDVTSSWPGSPVKSNWMLSGIMSVGDCVKKKGKLCLHNGHSETLMKEVTTEEETFYVADGIERDVSTDLRLYYDKYFDANYGKVSYRLEDRDSGTIAYFEQDANEGRHFISHLADRFDNDLAYNYRDYTQGPDAQGSVVRLIDSIVYGNGLIRIQFEDFDTQPQYTDNLPREIEISTNEKGPYITAYTYLVVSKSTTDTDRDNLQYNEISKCYGNVFYTAPTACIGDTLDLEYLAPDTTTAGIGGLSRITQYMGDTSRYRQTYYRTVSYAPATREKFPDAKLREIYTKTHDTYKYRRTYYDFDQPQDHPLLLSNKKLYTSVTSTDVRWKDESRVHHKNSFADIESPHFGLAKSTEVYMTNAVSRLQRLYGEPPKRRYIGKSSYTYHDDTRILANAVQEYYLNGTLVPENKVNTDYTLTENLGTDVYPIYKLDSVNKSVPSLEMVYGATRLNTTTQNSYGETNNITTIQKSSCAATDPKKRCAQTGKQQTFDYNDNGSLKKVIHTARLGGTVKAVDVLTTSFEYDSDGSGNIEIKTEVDNKGTSRSIKTAYEPDNIAVKWVETGPLKSYYGGENYLYGLGKYTQYSRNEGNSGDPETMIFTYDELGRLESTTANGVTMKREVENCTTIKCDRRNSIYRQSQTFSDKVTPDGYVEYNIWGQEIRAVREVDLDGSGEEYFYPTIEGSIASINGQNADKSEFLVTRNVYYGRQGRLNWEESPFLAKLGEFGGLKTEYEYTIFGQLAKVTAPSGETIDYTYDLCKSCTPGLTEFTQVEKDSKGNTLRTTRQRKTLLGTYETLKEENDGVIDEVRYLINIGSSVDNFARKVSIFKDDELEHQIFSDQLGNAYKEDSKTDGKTTRKHTAWGDVTESILKTPDGKKQKSVYLYLPEGRLKKAEVFENNALISTTNYEYDYCDRVENAVGKPCSVQRNELLTGTNYRRILSYDNEGRVDKRIMATQSESGNKDVEYSIDDKHNNSDQIDERTFNPSAFLQAKGIKPFTIKYEYGARGALHKIWNTTETTPVLIWQILKKEPGGNVSLSSLGTNELRTVREYEKDSGRLKSTEFTKGLDGNTKKTDLISYRKQEYFYDFDKAKMDIRKDSIIGSTEKPQTSEIFFYSINFGASTKLVGELVSTYASKDTTYFDKFSRGYLDNGDIDFVNRSRDNKNKEVTIYKDQYNYKEENGQNRLTSIESLSTEEDNMHTYSLEYESGLLNSAKGGTLTSADEGLFNHAILNMIYANGTPTEIETDNSEVLISRDADGRVGRIVERETSPGGIEVETWFFNNEIEHREVGDQIFVRYYIYAAAEGLHAPIASYVQNVTQSQSVTNVGDIVKNPTGWRNLSTGQTVSGEIYFGGYDSSINSTNTTSADTEKTFEGTYAGPGVVTITFDFLRRKSWDDETFYVYVNGTQLDLGSFNADKPTPARSGSTNNISWSMTAGSPSIGQDTDKTQVTITLTNLESFLTIGFGAALDQPNWDEHWGVANLNITNDVNESLVSWVYDPTGDFSYDGSTLTRISKGGSRKQRGTFSNESFVNNGGVSFEATETNKVRAVGLSNIDGGRGYKSIEYAIYLRDDGYAKVYEKGKGIGKFKVSYQTGDAFSIKRVKEEILYYKNNQLFYTSKASVTAATPLHIDTAFYKKGGSITNFRLEGLNITSNPMLGIPSAEGWVLIGRGREGWEFDTDGQGSADDVSRYLGTPDAFPVAAYSDATINQFLSQSGKTMADVEIRLKRATTVDGSGDYQEVRWRDFVGNSDAFTWDLDDDSVYTVTKELVNAPATLPGAQVGTVTNQNTRDGTASGNDGDRVFTWQWGGHDRQGGFSYGLSVNAGTNSPTNFLWEAGTENHSIPYTEVYLRFTN
jgi:hypothetical protein